MTQEEIVQKAKEEILSLLKGVDRVGMDKVIWYLNESTYFRAWGGSKHHGFSGGLAVHSLGVYKEKKKLNLSLPEDSMRIVALLHDICKAHLRSYDEIGKGHHGLRSALLLKALGLKFHTGEYDAIKNHMHRMKDVPKSKTTAQANCFATICVHAIIVTQLLILKALIVTLLMRKNIDGTILTRFCTAPNVQALRSSSTISIGKIV